MAVTTKDFRLSKTAKRQLALIPAGMRNVWKRCFIDAEVHEKANRNDPLHGIGGKSVRGRDNKGEE